MSLMTSNYTYSALSKKYDGFALPAYKISVGGTEIMSDSSTSLVSLEVTLSLEDTGTAHFFVQQTYDRENSSFEGTLSNTLKLGKIIEISLGYQSETTLVFKGFLGVLEVLFDVEDTMGFEVIAFDARWLMKTDNAPYQYYEKPNYSDIATTILSRYKSLCTPKVDSTSDSLTELFVQKESDFDCLMTNLGLKTNYEFFIVADEAYFRKRATESAFYSIDISTGLKHFSKSEKYLNRSLVVQGLDLAFSEAISATVTAKNSAQTDVFSAVTSVLPAPDCVTASQAKTVATSLQTALVRDSKTGQGIVLGLPEIVPGRYIEVAKLDSTVNGNYYINEVVHRIDIEGFTTTFSTKG